MKKLPARERIQILSGRLKNLHKQSANVSPGNEREQLNRAIYSCEDALRTAERDLFLERCERGDGL